MGMGIFKRRHKADQIKSTDDFEQAIAAGKPVLIDFMKYGCQPCQVMDGIVNEVSEEFLDEAIVVKANLEAVPELFGKFKVKSTPTAGCKWRWARRRRSAGKSTRRPSPTPA